MPKLDQVLEKLQKLEDQIQSVDEKVRDKVECSRYLRRKQKRRLKNLRMD